MDDKKLYCVMDDSDVENDSPIVMTDEMKEKDALIDQQIKSEFLYLFA